MSLLLISRDLDDLLRMPFFQRRRLSMSCVDRTEALSLGHGSGT